jgi:hypothetical protein
MPLSTRQQPYKIPEYSLTGDLLAYLTCKLQYRYHNKGSLPPSIPVQLWFGEFLHGVMEEAYLEWRDNSERRTFPWNWDPEIRNIEIYINQRLRAKGLQPTPGVFCPFDSSFIHQGSCPDTNHPHKLIASLRAEEAINTWGPHLFPLIEETEVKLKCIRDMPNYREEISRCNYYGITGIVDVISSVNLIEAPPGNLILHQLYENSELLNTMDILSNNEYEIIIDYKGMRRPSTTDGFWQHHETQIFTYGWLRSRQPQARTVIGGIIFYLNELAIVPRDMELLQNDVVNGSTDIMPRGNDLYAIRDWRRNTPLPSLTRQFREKRSIRIIPINDEMMQRSLQSFDEIVSSIENCVYSEMQGENITSCWDPIPIERNCTACDFKTYCPDPASGPYHPTFP